MRDVYDLAPHEALVRPLFSDPLVRAVYEYARRDGLTRDRFYETLVDKLIEDRHALQRALCKCLEEAPPAVVRL